MSVAASLSAPHARTHHKGPAESRGPLFVTGIWRSGTSLLYALLNQHPEIALLYEGDLPLLHAHWRSTPGDLALRWNFWNSAGHRHGIRSDCFRTSKPALAALDAYDAHRLSHSASISGEKSPSFYEHLPYLARMYPNASMIVIWRDPAEICRSIHAAQATPSWFRRRGIMTRALLGCELLKQGVDDVRGRGISVHEVTYSDLTRNTSEVMRGICAFLGIEYWPGMATLNGSDRSAIYEGQHHSAVKSDEIRAERGTAASLSSELAKKIARYVYFWRQRYAGTWPLLDEANGSLAGGPGLVERSYDAIAFRAYRALDAIILRLYCSAPLGSLARLSASQKPIERKTMHLRLASFVIGILTGMTSMGGAALMTPLLLVFGGLPAAVAVGTDLVYARCTKIFGAAIHFVKATSIGASLYGWQSEAFPQVSSVFCAPQPVPARFNSDQWIRRAVGIVLVIVAASILYRTIFLPREARPLSSKVDGRRCRLSRVRSSVSLWALRRSAAAASLRHSSCSCSPRIRPASSEPTFSMRPFWQGLLRSSTSTPGRLSGIMLAGSPGWIDSRRSHRQHVSKPHTCAQSAGGTECPAVCNRLPPYLARRP